MAGELPNFGEYPAEKQPGALTTDEKQWAMYCHMSALIGVLFCGVTTIGPLVLWQMKRQTSKFVDDNGKEAVNFQLNVFVYFLISLFLTTISQGYLFILTVGVIIYGGVMGVIAGMKANEGKEYRYPAIVRVIK